MHLRHSDVLGKICGVKTITCQFGAFLFGARQFDACQFGAFHFDAVPVRRVSVWRDASLARFTLPRFPFLCLNCTEVFSTSVWHVSRFAPMLIEYGEYGVARVAYKFVGVPFCKEVFLCAYLFFAYFPLCVVHHLFINLVNVHRGYTIVDLFINRFWSRFRLQNGYATQRDVCVVIVQCSRSRSCRVCVGECFLCAYLDL